MRFPDKFTNRYWKFCYLTTVDGRAKFGIAEEDKVCTEAEGIQC